MGDKLTRGLGVGGDPEIGRESAEESREELFESVKDSDMVFISLEWVVVLVQVLPQ